MNTSVPTYWAKIFVGFKDIDTGIIHTDEEAINICQQYVDEIGLCVTFEHTTYIYTNGCECGCVVGLINYPRFPSSAQEIQIKAINLGRKLMNSFNQYRVSIMFPEETIMLHNAKEER